MILSFDLGTTNWKAAAFTATGDLAGLCSIPTPVTAEDGHPCYNPAAMPEHLAVLLQGFDAQLLHQVELIAFTGMAEAGLLVDKASLAPRSSIWPWFDRRALPLFERVKDTPLFAGRSAATGLPLGFKYGVFKLLTLLEAGLFDPQAMQWAGLISYAASLFTGELCEDHTLAARTLCLDIHTCQWDEAFLDALGLSPANLPRLVASGTVAGHVKQTMFGLRAGIPVAICGHDHVCAAHSVDALRQGHCFLSTGTAQVMLRPVDQIRPDTGLSYGPSPTGMPYTCLGSIQSAGGSINYWKNLLYPTDGYGVLMQEAALASPGQVMYFPFLAGRGAPRLDPHARAALIGMGEDTSRGAVIAAVYAGIAMETRFVLEQMGMPQQLVCLGGLTRHEGYLHALADVTGAQVALPAMDEGTLYGAARLASRDALPPLQTARTIRPDALRHAQHTRYYTQRYLPLMNAIQWEE